MFVIVNIIDTEEFMNTSTKKTIFKIALLLVPAIFSFADDVSTPDKVPFSRIQRIDWNLAEVKTGSSTVIIDRTKAQTEIYSIRFQEGLIRGRGANNIYSAPYTAGEDNSLSIRMIASTYMLPLFEAENFSEYEYFRHLGRAYRWEFHDWKLKLYTYNENKEGAILVFIPIYK
jgi:heat shock protein HslJ